MSETEVSNKLSSQIDEPINVLFKVCENLVKNKGLKEVEYFAFGGWVRDSLTGDKPSDLDFFISDADLFSAVISMLKATGRIENVRIQGFYPEIFCSHRLSFCSNNGEKTQVDIICGQRSHKVNSLCDFTCNNLIMYSDGSIKTRCPAYTYTEGEWTLKCIRDAISKKLVIMANSWQDFDSFEKRMEYSWKLQERFKKMQEKGYTDTQTCVSSFKFLIPFTHLDVEEGCEMTTECSICSEQFKDQELPYGDNQKSVKLVCNHDFHYNCIKKWRQKGEENTCPLCRTVIKYKLRT